MKYNSSYQEHQYIIFLIAVKIMPVQKKPFFESNSEDYS